MSALAGRCACGAVTVRAEGLSDRLSACWCEPCRRWSGLVGMGIEVAEAGFAAEGPVQVWESSAIGRRAFCGVCGSALGFWPLTGAAVVEPCPGLFENAGGAVLHHENFVEKRPPAIRFDPEPDQLSAADYAARAPVVETAEPVPDPLAGGCACGAVRFRLDAAGEDCGACHCATCRAWTGGIFVGVTTRGAALHVEQGEEHLLRWQSSDRVERVSCGLCGGKLWYRVTAPEGDRVGGEAGDVDICLGALDDMTGRPLRREIFIEAKPAGYAFAAETERLTGAEAKAR
ncbi:hypothetical protein GI374_10970 [Paracoccus sp. S-4012]|uniref:GFA family protein n=1 Tax=Paracoccus sp. S-4012 TaxID=2665648 RepID=UPI0012AEE5F6|nr:GFA family protein [Paracoccus sp. S-4012]MRX50958.1 hypothetical protein [Paracoccus sp. S-4012]